ncbi:PLASMODESMATA CALLOSE-BINDING PROTEIN 2-like [Phragmites australis]|uniref:PLASMODESMATA CALLOSE-BINDING PROTEIN 2-like n=1 Tax=Phragmites australis TaxID=29695 RepID=UPI002D790369|nr:PLASMODESMATA CALLOSE-BINDING PROTEIN 2-like [Phragmites australis]
MRRRGRLPAALWLVAVAWAAVMLVMARPAAAAWCIARSGASVKALQAALDYACSPAGGADCAPIQASGLCYLPNTLAAHASYAFNSIFQRSRAAPGACDFAGTATITLTDPSYGSCTYPASPSTAGQSGSPGTPSTPTSLSPPGTDSSGGLNAPDIGPEESSAEAPAAASFTSLALSCFMCLFLQWW